LPGATNRRPHTPWHQTNLRSLETTPPHSLTYSLLLLPLLSLCFASFARTTLVCRDACFSEEHTMAATIPALGCSNHSRPDLQRYIPRPAAPGFPLTCVLADSLAAGAKTALDGMLSFYQGQEPGQIPGIFNQAQGYYWWIAGAAWNVSPDLQSTVNTTGSDAVLVAHKRYQLQQPGNGRDDVN